MRFTRRIIKYCEVYVDKGPDLMKRKIILWGSIGIILLAVLISSLAFDIKEGEYLMMDLNRELDSNSPEFLAKASGDAMMQALAGEITAEDLFEQTIQFSAATKDELLPQKAGFISSLNQSKSYFNQKNMILEKILYAETEYIDDDYACIRRIHRYNTGKQYYFCQYYKKTDGQWKVLTDTLENDFVLKKNFLIWDFAA